MTSSDRPMLFSKYEFIKTRVKEAEMAGFLDDILVELKNGNTYLVNFISYNRVSVDLKIDARTGIKFLADPGMIVLPDITLDNMQTAVNKLEEEGYFNALVPVPLSSIPPKVYPLK